MYFSLYCLSYKKVTTPFNNLSCHKHVLAYMKMSKALSISIGGSPILDYLIIVIVSELHTPFPPKCPKLRYSAKQNPYTVPTPSITNYGSCRVDEHKLTYATHCPKTYINQQPLCTRTKAYS